MNKFLFGCICLGLTGFAAWALIPSRAPAPETMASPIVSPALPFCTQSDPIERRVCLMQAAVDGASRTFISAKKPDMSAEDVRAYFSVLEVLSFVQSEVSMSRFGSWFSRADFVRPKNARGAVADAYGICGSHVLAFLLFAEKLGLKARPVEFWLADATGRRMSHVAVEILLRGKWVLADVSWGGLFLRDENDLFSAMSLEETRANPVSPRVNANNVSYAAIIASGVKPFYYLKAPDLQITRNQIGNIALYWQPAGNQGKRAWKTDFAHIPNFVGDNKPDGRQVGLQMTTNLPSGTYDFTLKVAGVGGCETSKLSIGGEQLAIRKAGEYTLQVSDPAKIEISGADDVCYVVFSEIAAKLS